MPFEHYLFAMKKLHSLSAFQYPLNLTSRVLAAIFGGYAVANIVMLAAPYILTNNIDDNLVGGMTFSFTAYAAAIIWVFAARTATRAWGGLLLASSPFILIFFICHTGPAPI